MTGPFNGSGEKAIKLAWAIAVPALSIGIAWGTATMKTSGLEGSLAEHKATEGHAELARRVLVLERNESAHAVEFEYLRRELDKVNEKLDRLLEESR